MEISLELFITVSLSFMFTFVFGKLVSMAATLEDRVISASAMRPNPEPEAGLKSLVGSIERNSFDEQRYLEEKEEQEEGEEIDGESIEVARFQRIPDLDRAGFAVEESKRLVEFHREVMVSDSDSDHLRDEYLEKSGFRKGICEIEIELVENMTVKANGEIFEEEEENREDEEIGDWVEIERKDLEMFGENDAVASGYSETN